MTNARVASAIGALVSCVAVVLPLGVLVPSAVAAENDSVTESSYIIQVPEGQTDALHDELAQLGASPDAVYDNALNGVAVSLTPSELADIKDSVIGEWVEADRPVELMATQASAPWNLSMLDYSGRPADTTYAYPSTAGAGVRVYVIDTGVVASPELGARLMPGVRFYIDPVKGFSQDGTTTDCYGHGSHVAGTIAGKTYGVAKAAYVVPIRVFDCTGSGATVASIVSGIDWAIANKPVGTVGVINMSLGSPCRSSLPCRSTDPFLVAVQRAIDAGFVVAVAAGNSNRDACSMTPAAAPNALTVGAVDRNDAEASFSNFGSCVDLYAPGVDVASINFRSPTTATLMSGTSMASPHVAGAAALFIAALPSATAPEVTAAIKDSASPNAVSHYPLHFGTTAELNIGGIPDGGSVGVPATAPTGLTSTATTLTSVGLSWQRSLSSSPVTDYVVSYRVAGSAAWTNWVRPPSLDLSSTVTGLAPGKKYEFRVAATTDVAGPPSAILRVTTLSGIPTTVTGIVSSGLRATSVLLSWAVAVAPGSSVTDYEVQYRPLTSSTWTTLNDGASASTSAQISTLKASTTYQIRVRGVSPFGVGPWSATYSVMTLSGIPAPVTGVVATATTPTTVTLSWSTPAGNGSDINDYVIEYKRSNVTTWTTLADAVSASPNAFISGLAPGATYNFRVTAKTGVATGPMSLPYSRATLSGKPGQVTALTISPTTSSAVVSWNAAPANGGTVTDYLIDYRLSTSYSWTRVADGVSPTPGASISGLKPGATYYVRVIGVSQFGSGTSAVTATRLLP